MSENGERSELIANKNAEPHRDDAHQQQPPNQISIRLLLATLFGGGGLAGILGLLARMVDNPWSIWANGAAVVCLVITMATTLYELYPRSKSYVVVIGMLAAFGVVLFTGRTTEYFWDTHNTAQSPQQTPIPTPAASLEQPAFHEKVEEATLIFGHNGLSFTANRRGFVVGNSEPIKLDVRNGVLWVNAKIGTSITGLPVIEIHDNDFVVRSPWLDRNSSGKAFEVVETDGDRPIFQLIRLNPSTIQVNGILPISNGLFAIGDDNGFRLARPFPSDYKLKVIF
jgi:hypothetical protein